MAVILHTHDNFEQDVAKMGRLIQRIWPTLYGFKQHDAFRLEWVDASDSDVQSINLPLPNRNVETRQIEMCSFVTLQRGATWRDLHLVFYAKVVDPNGVKGQWHLTSIPAVIIRHIVPLSQKQTLRKIKKLGLPKPPASRRHRRHTQHFPDGSVKHVD